MGPSDVAELVDTLEEDDAAKSKRELDQEVAAESNENLDQEVAAESDPSGLSEEGKDRISMEISENFENGLGR